MSLIRPPWLDRAELLGVSPSASEQAAAQALCALSAPSLHSLCTLSATSLRLFFALSSPSLRLFALLCAPSVHPLHYNQAVGVRQRAPASSCVVRPGACRPATALPHPHWLRSQPFSRSLELHPPLPPLGALLRPWPPCAGRRFDASHSALRSTLRTALHSATLAA